MNVLAGKVAVITGSTRGLGLALAEALAREGAAVVVSSRSADAVTAAVERLRVGGARASGRPVDVAQLAEVEGLAAHAVSEYGKLDIWVNNAGVAGAYGPTVDLAPEAFYRVIQTNIIGVYNGSRTALGYFLAQHSGKLINLLGHGYRNPVPWQNAYASSKAWIRSFTLALADETRGKGVSVIAFNPGLLRTDLLTDVEVISGSEGRLKNFPTIVRMWAKPPEQAVQKVVWLASPATDGKTGLLVSLFSPWTMLRGAARQGVRSLLRRPAPPLDIRVRTVAPQKPGSSEKPGSSTGEYDV
jgi:NAD(P)-dependent dehydrogenase (short-subunit alcohol dehydrogenase family)